MQEDTLDYADEKGHRRRCAAATPWPQAVLTPGQRHEVFLRGAETHTLKGPVRGMVEKPDFTRPCSQPTTAPPVHHSTLKKKKGELSIHEKIRRKLKCIN